MFNAIVELNARLQWREKIVYGLLFLFPLLGVSLRHWFSAIFVFFALSAIPALFKKQRVELYREEKILLLLLAAFFATFLLSAFINGWSKIQTRDLEVEIRFLLVIPLYLMLRRYPQGGYYLLVGSLLATFFLAVQSYYDVFIIERERAQGVYSPNLLGPVAAFMVLFSLCAWTLLPKMRCLIPFAVVAGGIAVALSGSRGAYLGLLVMGAVWLFFSLKGRQRLVLFLGAIVLILSSYSFVESVKLRVDSAINEVDIYLSMEDPTRYEGPTLGTLERFEMWRFTALSFTESPVFGIGRGNYGKEVGRYVEQGLVHPSAANHGHPHSAYAEALLSRGSVGFIIFMAMLFYPLFYYLKSYKSSPNTALLGALHVVGFAVFSLTDASTFIKGNFVSIFLLYLTVLFSWHLRAVKSQGAP